MLTQWDAYVNSILHCVILYIELHSQTNWEAETMVEFYFGLRICFRFVAFWPHIILWKILSNVKQTRTFHHNKMFHIPIINHIFNSFSNFSKNDTKMAKMFEMLEMPLMISFLFNKFNIDSEDAKAKFGADHKSLGPTTPQALKKRCHGT